MPRQQIYCREKSTLNEEFSAKNNKVDKQSDVLACSKIKTFSRAVEESREARMATVSLLGGRTVIKLIKDKWKYLNSVFNHRVWCDENSFVDWHVLLQRLTDTSLGLFI